MLFVIFIDNTWTARRLHIILNSSLFLFAGGECSREIEEMVHGREQKAAGLKGKSLNRKWTFVGSPKKYLKGIETQWHTNIPSQFSPSQERNEGTLAYPENVFTSSNQERNPLLAVANIE